mmetsp:Transcript_1547/g.1058  ORF Transcript_1547/g.1058 Transcript_1547/m.1058 type:complete len:712 (-) Transcript_1547:5176-7311(-)
MKRRILYEAVIIKVRRIHMTLKSLFRPKSVAVIGASTKELSIGNRVIRNLIDFDFKGDIYPINPKADEVRGIKAYKSILNVPDNIDVVHMVIPAKFVPQAVEECGIKCVKNIIINSGGFAEIGSDGEAIEKDFLKKAKKYGIRILGPNCQGIINSDPDIRAYCNFTFTKPDTGYISIVALSGGVAELIHQGFSELGVGTRIYASNGNACDITIPEIMEYLGNDDGTRVVVTYVEGLRDPETFMRIAKEVSAKKPVLAMKAGRTKEGAKAASSHTGGLAKEDLATDVIFKKASILTFENEGELISAATAFASEPIPKGNRVGIITNTGGPAVIATDVLVKAGLTLPHLSEKTKEFLKEKLYKEASINNPIDVLATGTAEHYRACLDAVMDDENFDCVYVNFVTPFFVDTDSIAKEIVEVNKQQRKPIICNLMTDKRQWTETLSILQKGGVPCFSLPSDAARAMTAMAKYNSIQNREIGEVKTFDNIGKAVAKNIIENAKQKNRRFLSAEEAYKILEAYGIDVADWKIAKDIEEAKKAATDIGFPIVVKADSSSVIHKSDMGAVAVNLKDENAVVSSISEMKSKIKSDDLQFFIQKYISDGLEIIVGAKEEKGLGHLIMFGLGGIYVEILKDVVFNLTPVTTTEAYEMLSSIKGASLLDGVRGQKGVFKEGITEIILKLSQLLTDLPMIKEMDLNPIIAFENRVLAVDARIEV